MNTLPPLPRPVVRAGTSADGKPAVPSPYDDAILAPALDQNWPIEPVEALGRRKDLSAWAEYAALRALAFVVGHAPHGLARLGVGAIARLARAADRRHSDSAREFLHTALPELSEDELEPRILQAWKHLIRVASTSADIQRKLLGRCFGDHFELKACEGVERVLAATGGCVLVTPHVGNWEVIGIPLSAMGFGPVYAVGKPPRNLPLSRHMQALRERQGGRLLPRKGAMKSVPAVIEAGGAVVMLLDQRSRKKPTIAPFFGRPARCNRSAGVLLRRLGAPVVFFANYTTEDPYRFELVFSKVFWPEDFTSAGPEEVATRVNHELERLILDRPDQYFWLHDRYRGATESPRVPLPAARGAGS